MKEKLLGKITFAEFGQYPDRPFLFGLQLGFESKSLGVFDGGKNTINISKDCKWERIERLEAIEDMVEYTNEILKETKVSFVSELIGKPVEITLVDNIFKDFRILTEVL